MELTMSHISRRKELLTTYGKTQRVPAQCYLLFISTHSSNGIIGDCSYKCSGFSEWLVILTPLLAGSNKRG